MMTADEAPELPVSLALLHVLCDVFAQHMLLVLF
jgi:hypothetical protein